MLRVIRLGTRRAWSRNDTVPPDKGNCPQDFGVQNRNILRLWTPKSWETGASMGVLVMPRGRAGMLAPKEQPPRESLRHTDREEEALLESRALPSPKV